MKKRSRKQSIVRNEEVDLALQLQDAAKIIKDLPKILSVLTRVIQTDLSSSFEEKEKLLAEIKASALQAIEHLDSLKIQNLKNTVEKLEDRKALEKKLFKIWSELSNLQERIAAAQTEIEEDLFAGEFDIDNLIEPNIEAL